jgi:hypothetical protein
MQKQIVLACALVFSGFLAQAQAPSTISTTPSTQSKTKAAPVDGTITSGQGRTKPTNRTKTVTKNNDGSRTVQINKANGSGTVQVTKIKPPKTKNTEPKVTRIREARDKQ